MEIYSCIQLRRKDKIPKDTLLFYQRSSTFVLMACCTYYIDLKQPVLYSSSSVVIVYSEHCVVKASYRYHELRPLISYFPCHWVDFLNTCPMKIVRIFYRIIAQYGRDIHTLTQSFPNQQWYNKSTYDLVERLLFPLSFYRRYIKFKKGIRMCPNFGWSLTLSILARFKPF